MKVAIDISPIDPSSPHNVRGSGFYLKNLLDALKKVSNITIIEFKGKDQVPTHCDLVHYPYFEPFFLTLPIKRNYKVIITIHDLTPIVFKKHFPVGLKGNMKWFLQKQLVQLADGIITDSKASREDIIKIINIPTHKVHVAPLAAASHFKKITVTDEKKKTLQEKYNLPNEFVLYVGDVTWNKNLPRLIRAVNKIHVPLILVGKAINDKTFDKTNPWNKDRITIHKLISGNPTIQTLGFVPDEDLVAIYNMATVFVMPSLYEGFGLPVLEAMSCGTPVITSKEGSLPEVGRDSVYYVNATSESSIADGIKTVFNDTNLQDALSIKSIKQAKEFSWHTTAIQTIDAYKSIVK